MENGLKILLAGLLLATASFFNLAFADTRDPIVSEYSNTEICELLLEPTYRLDLEQEGLKRKLNCFNGVEGVVFVVSALPRCEEGLKQRCFGVEELKKGQFYIGEFESDKHHGHGRYRWKNGQVYSGNYKKGSAEGFGTLVLGNGTRTTGQFLMGFPHGWGVKSYNDGSRYEGQFSFGKFNGVGRLILTDEKIKQEGIWWSGKIQNEQKVTILKNSIFAGSPDISQRTMSASSGSGFAVSERGYIITNHHVINGCKNIFIHTDGMEVPAKIIAYDKQNDLALLRGDFRPQTVFPLSESNPDLLQDIYVAGYPFGMSVSSGVKVTRGIVSSLAGLADNFSKMQIDAALQSGNSGGPILDDKGNVVGVAVSKLDVKFAIKNFGSIPENTNFGIKSSVVRSVLDSNGVDSPPANERPITKSELGKRISKGTFYISCWMTMAQIEKMRTKKVMFSDLD